MSSHYFFDNQMCFSASKSKARGYIAYVSLFYFLKDNDVFYFSVGLRKQE